MNAMSGDLTARARTDEPGRRVVIVGGGPAGFFAAIHCRAAAPATAVTLLEKSARLLAKVAISGGGRCNVTHACFDPRELAAGYPRGGRELIGPFSRWASRETIAWFEDRGVPLKTEADGRVFPVSDSSRSIVDCLTGEARRLGVEILTRRGLRSAHPASHGGGFELVLDGGTRTTCDCLLLATGGRPGLDGYEIAASLGHRIIEPVPSLFTFRIDDPGLALLAGVSLPDAELAIAGSALRQRGPLLITGSGISGPAVLALSAWGARELFAREYRCELLVNLLPASDAQEAQARLRSFAQEHPRRRIASCPLPPLPRRLWELLAARAELPLELTWAQLSRRQEARLAGEIRQARFPMAGKSTNKEEFVTCGGVSLKEVDFRRMASRLVPGLYFAGELLDIDGVTGGFNFQSAWTTGWIAGQALAEASR